MYAARAWRACPSARSGGDTKAIHPVAAPTDGWLWEGDDWCRPAAFPRCGGPERARATSPHAPGAELRTPDPNRTCARSTQMIRSRWDARRQQCLRVLRDLASNEPQHAYLVIAIRCLPSPLPGRYCGGTDLFSVSAESSCGRRRRAGGHSGVESTPVMLQPTRPSASAWTVWSIRYRVPSADQHRCPFADRLSPAEPLRQIPPRDSRPLTEQDPFSGSFRRRTQILSCRRPVSRPAQDPPKPPVTAAAR